MAAANAPDTDARDAPPSLSVVVPVHNEADNVVPLIDEIHGALEGHAFEIVYVDDGSTDGSIDALRAKATNTPRLRVVRHRTRSGQSAAIASGVEAARGGVIVTLDGDGQNDPADIGRLLALFEAAADGDALLVTGLRAKRRDKALKRLASRLANSVRAWALGDDTPDTGCGLKVFARALFLALPRFDHMHRFLPALVLRHGGRVVSVPVNHRRRQRGVSKYGVFDRLWIGIVDLLGVMWLQRRVLRPTVEDAGADDGPDGGPR